MMHSALPAEDRRSIPDRIRGLKAGVVSMTSRLGAFRIRGFLLLALIALMVGAAPAQAAPDRSFNLSANAPSEWDGPSQTALNQSYDQTAGSSHATATLSVKATPKPVLPDVNTPPGVADTLASNPALGFTSHSEPQIAQSPTNPNILIAGSKMYNKDRDALKEYEFK